MNNNSVSGEWSLDPVSETIFRPSLSENGRAGGGLSGISKAKHVFSKSERVEIPRLEISRLALELGMYTFASLSPTDADTCVADLHAETRSPVKAEAIDLLNHINLSRYGSELITSTPITERMATMAKCYLNVTIASDCPIDIRGCFSRVEVLKMSGPVMVSLAYGGASLLQTTGKVSAQTGPEGRIIFSGCRGQVSLKSAGEINLEITEQTFDGNLEASTRATPIRVLLPRGFSSSFQVSASKVICRADTASQVHQYQQGESVVASYGPGEPRLRLQSFRGPVVIDNKRS